MKTYVHTKICTRTFIAVLFTTAKNWKQLNCPSTGEQINKMCYTHTMECYLAIKWSEVLIHA